MSITRPAPAHARLAREGRRILATGRNPEALNRLRTELEAAASGPAPLCFRADLADLDQVRSLCRRIRARIHSLDALVHSAGLLTAERRQSPQGHELQLAVNHLAVVQLTEGLMPLLNTGAAVVTVASKAHRFGHVDRDDPQMARRWSTMGSYRRSKLMAVAWSRALARRRPDLRVSALHPGVVDTGMGAKDAPWLVKTAWRLMAPLKISVNQAAEHVEAAMRDPHGGYFDQGTRVPASTAARDHGLQDWVWTWSRQALGRASA